MEIAGRVGYPVVVRPSYVLGGGAMEIVYNDDSLQKYLVNAVEVDPDRPVLVDKYLLVFYFIFQFNFNFLYVSCLVACFWILVSAKWQCFDSVRVSEVSAFINNYK